MIVHHDFAQNRVRSSATPTQLKITAPIAKLQHIPLLLPRTKEHLQILLNECDLLVLHNNRAGN
jgi:hypothetical protein